MCGTAEKNRRNTALTRMFYFYSGFFFIQFALSALKSVERRNIKVLVTDLGPVEMLESVVSTTDQDIGQFFPFLSSLRSKHTQLLEQLATAQHVCATINDALSGVFLLPLL